MAGPQFVEILRCNGVDQTATPYPGMIVPFHGENQVVLETSGMDVQVQNSLLNLQEFKGRDLTVQLLRSVQDGLSQPDVDPQQKDAFMPAMNWRKPRFFRVLGTVQTRKPRFFRVLGTVQTGFPGTFVDVVSRPTGRGRMPAIAARLQVAVLDRMVVKVAIRNVRARDGQGKMRFHAKRPCDPAQEVARMNAIWTPQTNIAFELVPSGDVDLDHNDPKTQEQLRIAYGLKSPATFLAESTVRAEKNWGWCEQNKVAGTDITFFVVHLLHTGGDPVYGKGGITPNGVMNRESGVSFVSDTRLPSTFAHEAGHYVGDMGHQGEDIKLLMRGEGSGYKIPFALAKQFRESFARRRTL